MHRFMIHLDDLAGLDMVIARDGRGPAARPASRGIVAGLRTACGLDRVRRAGAERAGIGRANGSGPARD